MRAAHHLTETGFIPPSAQRRSQFATLPDNRVALKAETVGRRRAMQHVIGPPSVANWEAGVSRRQVHHLTATPYLIISRSGSLLCVLSLGTSIRWVNPRTWNLTRPSSITRIPGRAATAIITTSGRGF